MRPATWWPVAVIAVLGLTVAANAYLLLAANDPNASVVEPDYYRRALKWDSTAAITARSGRLGWRAEGAIGTLDPAGLARVAVRLTGRDGLPVRGARVRVTAIHNREAARHLTSVLAEAADAYVASLPLRHAGLWELRVEAERDSAQFVARLRCDTGGGFPP